MTQATPDQDRKQSTEIGYGRSSHYAGEGGQAYQELRTKWPLAKMAVIHAEKFASAIRATDTVVDFGCGSGEILASISCGRRIGIEVNASARESARLNGLEVYDDTAEIPSGIADVVVSHHALEHVPYPIQALAELNRILKPSGVLRICVPVEYPHRSRTYDPDDVANHLHTWTVQLLGNTLREAGFQVTPESVWIISRRFPRPLVNLYPYLPGPLANTIGFGFAQARRHREIMANVRPVDTAALIDVG